MKDTTRDLLQHLYTDIGKPYALSSPRKLYEAAKAHGISLSDCIEFLNSKDDYSLHRATRLNFPRNHIIISGPRKTLVSDLADLSKLSRYNNQIKYLLIVMDAFSRLLKVYPMRNKTGKLTADNLKEAMESPDFVGVSRLFVDKGSEYDNTHTKTLYRDKKVKHYSTYNSRFKTSLAERVIRTIKAKIFRFLTYNNTKRYIDVLPHIVNSYNDSIHRTLKATPRDVHMNYSAQDIERLFHQMYGTHKRGNLRTRCVIDVGSVVRIATDRREFVFRKGYEIQNTFEKFVVARIDTSQREPIFFLKDFQGEEIKGAFYRYELVKTC